jgi:hypothetical protein
MILLAVALCLLATTGPVSAEDPGKEVALVTSVSGKAVVRSGEQELPLKLGARLLRGDEVSVTGGKVAIVFLDGAMLSLNDGETLRLGATPDESTLTAGGNTRGLGPDDAMNVADGGLQTGTRGRDWRAQLASVSGIRGDGLPIAVAPRLAIAAENPTFYWFDTDTSGAGSEKTYTLVLKNEEQEILASRQIRGPAGKLNSFRFDPLPAGFTATPRVHFSWAVLTEGATVPEGQLDAGFVFVDQAGIEAARGQASRLRSMLDDGRIDAASYHTLLCTMFLDERERLFSDGLPHLLALAALPDGADFAGEQLARVFLRFGNQVATLAPLFSRAPGAYIGK